MVTPQAGRAPNLDRCPYGVPGDRLWVREEWRVDAWDENAGQIAVEYRAGAHCLRDWRTVSEFDSQGREWFDRMWQESSDDAIAAARPVDADGCYHWAPGDSPCRWRRAIHMPRWAGRLTLDVTDVRVERMQKIRGASRWWVIAFRRISDA